jgi:hypothetical protein
MKELIQVESWVFAFSNTPMLQYSKTALNLYPRLVLKTTFLKLNEA